MEPDQVIARVRDIVLPADIRDEWPRASRDRCQCGWAMSVHPTCVACGTLIGPNHVERYARPAIVDVYVDTFDDSTGMWYLSMRREERRMCLSCSDTMHRRPFHLRPIRSPSSLRFRLAKTNVWRRRRGLAPLMVDEPDLVMAV